MKIKAILYFVILVLFSINLAYAEQTNDNASFTSEFKRLVGPEEIYNLGVSEFRKGEYRNAATCFEKVASETAESELRFKSLYNLGNAKFKQNDFDNAINAYKSALDGKQDLMAEYNLKVAEKKKEELQNQQQQQNGQNGQSGQDGQKDQNGQNDQNNQQSEEKQQDAGDQQNGGSIQGGNQQNNQQKNGNKQSGENQNLKDDKQNGEQQGENKNQQSENQQKAENQEGKQSGDSEDQNGDKQENDKSDKEKTDDDKGDQNGEQTKEQESGEKKSESGNSDKERKDNNDDKKQAEVKQVEEQHADVNLGKNSEPEPGTLTEKDASQRAKAMKNIKANPYMIQKLIKQMEEREAELQYKARNEGQPKRRSFWDDDFMNMDADEIQDFMRSRGRDTKINTNEPDW